MSQTCPQLTTKNDQQQQQRIIIPIISQQAPSPNLPRRDLLAGPREDYLRYGVPLYEASIRCGWKAAKAIIEREPDLVRCSITVNGETPLHVAASMKRSGKQVEKFVKNLVDMMENEDLELQNKGFNMALYLAGSAGNIKTVVIMVEKHRSLMIIPDDDNQTIFHIAIKYRHEGIYNLLYEICSMMDLITPLKDVDDKNMLHMVGKGTTKERLADVSGPAICWNQAFENQNMKMVSPS